MSILSISLLIASFLILLLSFNVKKLSQEYSKAEANKIEGLYIFCDSKPIMPYDSIGTVEIGFVSGTQYQSIRDNLIKRSKKQYQNFDGLILHLSKKGVDNCTVIKFKPI